MGLFWSLGTTIAKMTRTYTCVLPAQPLLSLGVLGIVVIKNMGYREPLANYKRMKVSLQLDLNLFSRLSKRCLQTTQLRRFLFFSSFANASFNASFTSYNILGGDRYEHKSN